MAERRFLSQYIAVSREKRLTISVSLSYIRATIWVKIKANYSFGFG